MASRAARVPSPTQLSTAQVVDRLNRQLYASTPLEKYVTFFFAIYDARTRNLSYTNAGHLPPILFRDGKIDRLRTGGTVVGLFPGMTYEVGEVQVGAGRSFAGLYGWHYRTGEYLWGGVWGDPPAGSDAAHAECFAGGPG